MKPSKELKKIMIKILNLKLVILLENKNVKISLQKVTLQVGMKKFSWLKKLKILWHGLMLLLILTAKKFWTFLRKRIGKKKSKRVPNWKNNKEKRGINYMLNGKDTIICLIVGLIKIHNINE